MRTTSHTRSLTRSPTDSLARPLATAGALLAAAAVLAAPAGAQGRWGRGGNGGYDNGSYGRSAGGARSLYEWSGRVDREAYIVMQSGDVRTRVDGGYDNRGGGRVRVASDLPQGDGVIDVRLAEGRGRVDVVEQPSQRNGYRAVVRVRDDDAGAGYYRFVTTWRPAGGYADAGRDGRYGDGRYGDGRDRDGRDRDGRDRDGRDRDGRDRDGRDRDGRDGDGRYNDGRDGGVGGAYGGSGVLHWRGRVDDVAEIRLQGGRVEARTVSGQGTGNVRSRLEGAALPARDVAVRVTDRSGRGRVSVVQQPHAWNGYTAVVRVEDHDAGAGYYDLDVSW